MSVRIMLKPNGPIVLDAEDTPFPVLQTDEGADITLEKKVFLCCCGASQKKPFCDGAHVKVGYSSENRCTNDTLQTYESPHITVHFNRSICSGAAECLHNLPSVFKNASVDWIHPGEAPVADVIATVNKCPSGALTYTMENVTTITGASEAAVKIVKNGPYEITGPVKFAPPKWSENASKTKFALCRCGKSANNPFCDHSHGEQKWEDDK